MQHDLDRLVRTAFVRLGQHDHRGAAELFSRAVSARPDLAVAWDGLSAALIGMRLFREAQRAAERALAREPGLATAHANRGLALKYQHRFDDSVAAHAEAVRLTPGSARARAQLGLALKAAGRLDEAEASLREAMALDPALAMARRNLAVLLVKRDRSAEAVVLLGELLAREGQSAGPVSSGPAGTFSGGVSKESVGAASGDTSTESVGAGAAAGAGIRGDTTAALLARAIEDERMREAVACAMAAGSPDSLVAAVAATPAARLGVDIGLLRALERLASQGAGPARSGAVVPGLGAQPWWPRVEAHFNLHRGDALEQVLLSAFPTAAVADANPRTANPGSAVDAAADAAQADLAAAAQAVAQRIALSSAPPVDGTRWEARIRWYHALLARHHRDWLPGRFKMLPSLVSHNPTTAHTPPDAVAGTLRAIFDELVVRMPPGLERAALVMVTVGRVHPFIDANGRIVRLLTSGECEAAGLGPLVVPERLRVAQQSALVAVSRGAPLAEVVAVLNDALAFTRELAGRLSASAGPGARP